MTLFVLAPAGNMNFGVLPSGSTYVSDADGLIRIANNSVADELALIALGCVALNPLPGGIVSVQTGTAYTIASADQGNAIVFTNAGAVTATLPNSLPVGFAVTLLQGGAGTVTAAAASGASLVSPNGQVATAAQYGSMLCLVIANANGTSAQWDILQQGASAGAGLIGATTLANLYSQDTSVHYAQYSVAQVFADPTPANDGTWLKTGTGNGSGNWAQQSNVTVSGLGTLITAEVARASASESGIFQAVSGLLSWVWADDQQFESGWFDAKGAAVFAITSSGELTGSATDSLPVLGYAWADDGAFAAGTPLAVDPSGNVILPYGAAPGALDDYCPYIGTDGGVHATNNAPGAAGPDLYIASSRGTIRGGPIGRGPIVTWMDDATASGNAPLHERRKFDYRGGEYLAGVGGITKLVQVIDIGHSLTVGGTAALLTTAPFFARGVMFSGGPKVVQMVGGAWNTPAPICDDGQIPRLAEYYEFQNSSGEGESHGGGVVQWFGTGSNLGATEAILFSSVGAGGATLANLLSGTTQYSNMLRVAERGAAIAAFNGWAYEVYVTCSIGENDYVTYDTVATGFQTNLAALQTSLETDLKAVFTRQGWSAPAHIPLVCEQPSSWTDSIYNFATCALVYVFPALVRASPTLFAIVGPEYYTDNYSAGGGSTSVHKTALGYKLDGQYMARVVQKIRAAAATPGLYATGASNSGTTLTLTTSATTNLAIDTSVVSDPGQSGLRCLDTSNGNANVALSSIAVSGTSVTATMASKTAGHVYMVGIGDIGTAGNLPGPTSGPRTCIRDSSADVSSSDTGSTPMYNYLSHDQITFTAV